MIICMCDIIVLTNHSICRDNFLTRIELLAKAHPKAIVLREKEFSESEYIKLAKEVISKCNQYGTICILHNYVSAAKVLKHNALHLPLPVLRSLSPEERSMFKILGASCHSVEEAKEAEALNCTYITAGHIFDTDCKRGLPGRGLDFLKNICNAISIPVYAIGGIDSANISDVLSAGAAGACVMSGAMVCGNVPEYLASFKGK